MSVEGASLTSGSVGRHLFRQTLPMVIGILAIMSVGLVDAYFIGQLGRDPLTAVSFIFPVVMALSSLGVGIIAAIASVVARALGAGQRQRAQSLVALGVVAAAAFGLLVTLALLLGKTTLFEWMNVSPTLAPLVDAYMTPFSLGFPLLLLNMAGNGALRAQGHAGQASLILMAMAIANLILDPILITGAGLFDGFGIQGAAYATVLGWVLACVLSLSLTAKSPVGLSLTALRNADPGTDLRALARVGAPAAVSNSVNPMGLSILTALLAQYGDAAVAGFGAGGRLQALVVVPLLALSSSIGGIVGQNWGAGYGDRARRALWMALAFCLIYGLLAGALLAWFSEPLGAMFTDDADVLAAIESYLWISVWGYAGFGALIVVNGAFNAIDRAYWALGQSVLRVTVFMIPVAIGLSMVLESRSIYTAELIANVLGGVIAVMLGRALLDDRWLRK